MSFCCEQKMAPVLYLVPQAVFLRQKKKTNRKKQNKKKIIIRDMRKRLNEKLDIKLNEICICCRFMCSIFVFVI